MFVEVENASLHSSRDVLISVQTVTGRCLVLESDTTVRMGHSFLCVKDFT